MKQKIVITTGDSDGIGVEVTTKALRRLGPKSNVVFFVYIASKDPQLKILLRSLWRFKPIICASLFAALNESRKPMPKNALFIIRSDGHPADWVWEAGKLASAGLVDGLVTAPLSKPEIKKAGYSDVGHTDILKRVSKTKNQIFMTFLGEHFNVALVTAHIPVSSVERSLNKKLIQTAITEISRFRDRLKIPGQIAVLGLDPHAGDGGIIGSFDTRVTRPVIIKMKKSGYPVSGPWVPDSAFHSENSNDVSFYLALYHDQGLIPFKAIHGHDSGVHVSVGLPFIRTSVDHGTAKDIFGKNKANANSMFLAIKWALRLAKSSKNLQ